MDGYDAVIDLEITANRPDCLSVLGIAREVATLYDTLLKMPRLSTLGAAQGGQVGNLRVTIEDAARCPRYCAALAEVQIAPYQPGCSSDWRGRCVRSTTASTSRTTVARVRYPMHSFDFDRLRDTNFAVRAGRPANV